MIRAGKPAERDSAEIECANRLWAAENGMSIEWARGMWFCGCPECEVSA